MATYAITVHMRAHALACVHAGRIGTMRLGVGRVLVIIDDDHRVVRDGPGMGRWGPWSSWAP